MSDATMRALPADWLADAVTPTEREALFEAAKRDDAVMAANKALIARGGYIVGGIGAAIGALGIACAAVVFLAKQAHPPSYIPFDSRAGTVAEAVPAQDAAKRLFGREQAVADLRAYVDACDSWIPEIADANAHKCLVMSAPDQQAVVAAAISPKNPKSPVALFKGKAISIRNDNYTFTPMAPLPNGVQQWDVRFDRTEVNGGVLGPAQRIQAIVTFSWHPELPMANEEDRSLNASGFQCLTYSSGPA